MSLQKIISNIEASERRQGLRGRPRTYNVFCRHCGDQATMRAACGIRSFQLNHELYGGCPDGSVGVNRIG